MIDTYQFDLVGTLFISRLSLRMTLSAAWHGWSGLIFLAQLRADSPTGALFFHVVSI